MATGPAYVYALTDPDGTVRYVGKSTNPGGRIACHASAGGSAVGVRSWIRALRASGREPGLVILAEVPPGESAFAWENRFIREHEGSGKLLNVHLPDGSNSGPRMRCSICGERGHMSHNRAVHPTEKGAA